MSKNVGSIDRILRLVVGLVLIGTAGMSFCPIYRILGMRTNK